MNNCPDSDDERKYYYVDKELERLREIRLILHDPFSNRDHQVIDMIIDYLMDKRFSK